MSRSIDGRFAGKWSNRKIVQAWARKQRAGRDHDDAGAKARKHFAKQQSQAVRLDELQTSVLLTVVEG